MVVGEDSQPFNCTAAHVMTPEKQAALMRLLEAASAWVSAAFSVVEPVQGPLIVADTQCGFGGDITIPPEILRDGAPETDVLAFVTARPILGTALAFAGHCQEDQGSTSYVPRRPSVGHINVDPASLLSVLPRSLDTSAPTAATAAAIADLVGVLLHETFHVLGFSRGKLLELPCPGALDFNRHQEHTYELRPCAAGGGIEPVVEQPTADGRTHPLLISPRVRDMARRHFGCSTLMGVPLEACRGGAHCSSGTGTAASHWEKRVLLGEVMVGAAAPLEQRAVSKLTLAVFEDFGWYTPHYAVGEPRCFYRPRLPGCTAPDDDGSGDGDVVPPRDPLLWGARAGCAFVEDACSGPAWRSQGPGYWCAAHPDAGLQEQREHIGAESCTVGRRAVGRCTLREFDAALPLSFRYFAAQPSLGGRAMEDYCPVSAPASGWDCRVPPHPDSAEAADVDEAATRRGEARCEGCRCFASSLYNLSGYVTAERRGCYPHRCASPARLQLQVAGRWYDCNAFNQSIAVRDWTGRLRCPEASELCAGAPDLQWPEIRAISPSHGPAAGGTLLTIHGRYLLGRGVDHKAAPWVRICGRAAAGVRLAGLDGEGNRTNMTAAGGLRTATAVNATGDLANEHAIVLALTPARPESKGVADAARCDVLVNATDDHVALGWFTYDGDPPPACHLLADLNNVDWNSVDEMVALFICVCPMVLTAMATLAALRLGWMVRTRERTLRRLRLRAKQRRAREARVREEPL